MTQRKQVSIVDAIKNPKFFGLRFKKLDSWPDDLENLTIGLSTVQSGHTMKLIGSCLSKLMTSNESVGHLGQLRLKCQCSPLRRNSIVHAPGKNSLVGRAKHSLGSREIASRKNA
jgi:hypothetical protein